MECEVSGHIAQIVAQGLQVNNFDVLYIRNLIVSVSMPDVIPK